MRNQRQPKETPAACLERLTASIAQAQAQADAASAQLPALEQDLAAAQARLPALKQAQLAADRRHNRADFEVASAGLTLAEEAVSEASAAYHAAQSRRAHYRYLVERWSQDLAAEQKQQAAEQAQEQAALEPRGLYATFKRLTA